MKEIDIWDNYYSIDEVAKFMDLTPKALKNRICCGKNHPPVIKAFWKFRKDSFHKWVRDLETYQINKVH